MSILERAAMARMKHGQHEAAPAEITEAVAIGEQMLPAGKRLEELRKELQECRNAVGRTPK